YRHALQYFWFSRVGGNPEVREDAPTLRAGAQDRIQGLVTSAPTPKQRSDAANLLGVLVVTTPTPGADPSAVTQILTNAAKYFQLAISIDPSNLDAKQNLEIVLRLQRPGRAQRLRVRARPRRGDHGVRLLMLALSGVSFLTPLDALFALAAAVPIAALAVAERRSARVRRLLSLRAPGRRAMLPVAIALVLLPALVAVAAAQPVVVRQQMVSERADAQAFVVFDTSLSMHASAGPGKPTRLARAKRIAIRLQRSLADVPMGIASMTDRALPNIMPTTDSTLFRRTVEQAIHVDEPPPSQQYRTRATTFTALVPLVESRFFAQKVQRRLVIVLTDGESTKI